MQVAAAADTALQETLQSLGQLLQAGQALETGGASGLLAGSLDGYADGSSITSLNTVAERGVSLQVGSELAAAHGDG
jgi:hypothetical protein